MSKALFEMLDQENYRPLTQEQKESLEKIGGEIHSSLQDKKLHQKEFPMDLAGIMRSVPGKVLLERGFTFFREEREYQLDQPDKNGVVRVYSKCRETGSDADGYGGMEYFDWWMMDTNLEPIPGIKVFYGYSPPDLFGTRSREKWYEQYDLAVEILKQRKEDQYDAKIL